MARQPLHTFHQMPFASELTEGMKLARPIFKPPNFLERECTAVIKAALSPGAQCGNSEGRLSRGKQVLLPPLWAFLILRVWDSPWSTLALSFLCSVPQWVVGDWGPERTLEFCWSINGHRPFSHSRLCEDQGWDASHSATAFLHSSQTLTHPNWQAPSPPNRGLSACQLPNKGPGLIWRVPAPFWGLLFLPPRFYQAKQLCCPFSLLDPQMLWSLWLKTS